MTGLPRSEPAADQPGAQLARRVIRERVLRARFFPYLKEAGWLMLVDLYANVGRDVSVTSACLASFGPPTTALRHIEVLERDGLIWREANPMDGRCFWLRLTMEARARLAGYFAECRATRTPGAVNLGGGIEPSGNSCAPADFLQPVHDGRGEGSDSPRVAPSVARLHATLNTDEGQDHHAA